MIQHHINQLAQVNAFGGDHQEVCTRGIRYWQDQDRIRQTWYNSQSGTFTDSEFGKQLGIESLYVRGYLPADDDMEPRYRNVNIWKRPTELASNVAVNAPPSSVEVCNGNCTGYRGKQIKTKSGRTCSGWPGGWPEKYAGAGLESNFCRNPDGDSTIWCFTTDPKKEWEHCEPLKPQSIEVCSGDKCSGYRGKQTKTVSGFTCKDWSS